MENPVFKAGQNSESSPYTYTLSTEQVDRMGDVIRADGWDLSEFRKNPIALVGHDHTKIVGIWTNVKVVGKKLMGTLKLAEPGTSELVDVTRKLIDQGILKAVSVGFQPVEAKPRKSGDGFEFIKSALHEVSLVAVPANPGALATKTAKAMMSPEVFKTLYAQSSTEGEDSGTGQSTHTQTTPHLDAARTRLKALGID